MNTKQRSVSNGLGMIVQSVNQGLYSHWFAGFVGCGLAWSALMSATAVAGVGHDIQTGSIRYELRRQNVTIEGELRCAAETGTDSRACDLQVREFKSGKVFSISSDSRTGLEILSNLGSRVRLEGVFSADRSDAFTVKAVEKI